MDYKTETELFSEKLLVLREGNMSRVQRTVESEQRGVDALVMSDVWNSIQIDHHGEGPKTLIIFLVTASLAWIRP